jgi:hypothetical protein
MTARHFARVIICSLLAFTAGSFYLGSSNTANGQASDRPQAAGPKQDVKSNEDSVFKEVRQAITNYHLTKLPLSCLKLEVTDRKKKTITVSVYEIHNDTCGGDQAVQPRLFGVRFYPKSGQLWSDANSDDGEYERLTR